jgi:hypothetical protein
MKKLRRLSWVVVALAVVYSAWIVWSRRSADRQWEEKQAARDAAKYANPLPAASEGPKVLLFYASPPAVARGDRTLICYGVANAASVRLEPAIEEIKPSFNRCIETRPTRSVTYTLHATGPDGRTTASTIQVSVGAAAAPARDSGTGPQILYFSKKETKRDGERVLHSLCFATERSTEVRLEPAVLPPLTTAMGCFWVAPEQRTTYTVIASDAEGRSVRKSLTVDASGT